ncbi:MAG: hypothetical protein LBJ94_00045 [Puniceicoccales bacterium]|nr:hypothetical protein [Puniceicoccales bacterium]
MNRISPKNSDSDLPRIPATPSGAGDNFPPMSIAEGDSFPNLPTTTQSEGEPSPKNVGLGQREPEVAAAPDSRSAAPTTDANSIATQVRKNREKIGFFSTLAHCVTKLKWWGEAKLELAAQKYLSSSPGGIDEVSTCLAQNIHSTDPKIFKACANAVKNIGGESTVARFAARVDEKVQEELKDLTIARSENVSLQNFVVNADCALRLVKHEPSRESSPIRTLRTLSKFAQKFPQRAITPADITLATRRPDLTERFISSGKIDLFHASFSEKADHQGLALECSQSSYNHGMLCSLVNEELFSDINDVAMGAIEKLQGEYNGHYFIKDGIGRCSIPNMHLPNGVEVIGNGDGGDRYCQETGAGEYDGANYTRYLLGKFKEAYGEKALAAFYVYLQNFTGSGNLVSCIALAPLRFGRDNLVPFFGNLMNQAARSVTMRMDENFNATYDIVYDMSTSECSDYINSHAAGFEMPPEYSKNSTIVAVASSTIPAAYDPNGANVYEQHKQYKQHEDNGRQETYLSFIASF